MEDIWLSRAKRLQAIASCGLHYATGAHDRERYSELADLANAMLADLGNVPLRRIEELVPDFARSYATPRVDVRGAVIEGDRILLVQEASDGKWALPGGFADVGASPSENVVREIREAAGIEVTARHLYNRRHKARGSYPADVRDFFKLFSLCERADRSPSRAGGQTRDAAFFARGKLPPLSLGRVLPEDIAAAFAAHAQGGAAALFD